MIGPATRDSGVFGTHGRDAGKEEKARHERLMQQALSLAHIKRNAKK